MVSTSNPFKDQSSSHHFSLTKKVLPWLIYSLIPIALFRLCFFPLNFPSDQEPPLITHLSASTSSSLPPPILHQETADGKPATSSPPPPLRQQCDYSSGKWVPDERGPLYNGTSCGTIKAGQNCMAHGRPDLGFLNWRWRPNSCPLPRFDPEAFLRLIAGKHIAFVGDSMARNQAESLLCMLATSSTPNLVHSSGDAKFRRWLFQPHNATVSIYWSPFLVQGVEKAQSGPPHNILHLDQVDPKWADDVDKLNFVVLSIGHWFLHPAVYHESGSAIGCHYCPGQNHTEIGFYDPLRKAIRTAIRGIKDVIEVKGAIKFGGAVLTTFSPSHFEGEWDKAGACPRSRPYDESEKRLEGMDGEIRGIEIEEVDFAKKSHGERFLGHGFDLEALDVTGLGLMRPDGHPGPYMNPFPFSNRKNGNGNESVQNDCVHWCLPGPIDTWNEILLQVLERWESDRSKRPE